MEKQLIIEGSDVESFSDYLEAEEERHVKENGAVEFKYERDFNKEFDDTLSADLISIMLTGFSTALGQLLLNFAARKVNNDVTIKTRDKNGNEITISMKNRTDAEVLDFLKKAGIELN
jgi:hypothetical protein